MTRSNVRGTNNNEQTFYGKTLLYDVRSNNLDSMANDGTDLYVDKGHKHIFVTLASIFAVDGARKKLPPKAEKSKALSLKNACRSPTRPDASTRFMTKMIPSRWTPIMSSRPLGSLSNGAAC